MSNKKAKAIRKEARHEISKTVDALQSQFKVQMDKMLKEPPKWCPGFI